MCIRFFLTVITVCLFTIAAHGATVQVDLPIEESVTHDFDLGVQISQVIECRLHVEGQAVHHYYECHNLYPGGEVDYDLWEPTHVYFQIVSNNRTCDNDWYTPNGAFDEDVDMAEPTNPAFLSDGLGTFTYEAWVELFPPESDDCGLSIPGSLDFTRVTLIVDYVPALPNETSNWSAIKTLFE